MLTEEQIDNLTEGDTLLLAVILERKINHCTFKVKTSKDSCVAASTIRLSLPPEKPKYNPCRLFKKGDKVRVVEKDGRTVHDPLNGGLWEVGRNERTRGACETSVLVHLFYEDEKIAQQISVPYCFLELVTPVEELEPYKLIDSPNTYNIVRDKETVMTIHKKSHPNAKAAAEAERDRLNAEYRKEHSND